MMDCFFLFTPKPVSLTGNSIFTFTKKRHSIPQSAFFISGKMEFLVRGMIFGGGKKIEMFFRVYCDWQRSSNKYNNYDDNNVLLSQNR